MGYEGRMAAAQAYIAEAAREAYNNGEFDDDIRQAIANGDWDKEVINRIIEILGAWEGLQK